LIKREAARKQAKKKRLMIMTVVKCRAFATKMKNRIVRARERRIIEAKEKLILDSRKQKKLEHAKILEKLTKDNDNSFSESAISHDINALHPVANGLIASESVGSLLTLNN
jgi:hypothetical protein